MASPQHNQITQKQLDLRNQLWPGLLNQYLWLRKEKKGFTTIPRTMPLLFEIMNSLSPAKPVSSVYFDLWCRAHDECFVTLNKRAEMAFHSGYTGQRAEATWISRMKILQSLNFIDVKPGPSGPLSYALIWNPYLVIKDHFVRQNPLIQGDQYNALIQRCIEIGANDLQ